MSKASKPEWVGKYGTNYDEVVKSWGFEVVDSETFGSYQGDMAFILRDGDRVGLSLIGYGSCSGCDALEAAAPYGDDEDDDWSDVLALRESLRKEIRWADSHADMAAWIAEHPENRWWSYDEDVKAWVDERFPAGVSR